MILSIITVCKNSSSTIRSTIESIVAQKPDNVEYIVVDGGSTDATLDIIHSYGNKIDLFISEPDAGISDAFNKGISRSNGNLVALINSDDSLLPGTIQKVTAYFSEHPDVDVIHGDLLLYKGAKFVKRVKPAGRWWYPWRLVLFNHPATFVRKRVYDAFGLFSLEYRIAMDIDIYLRWVKKNVSIYYLPEPLVVMHYGGLSDRDPFAGYREAKRAFLNNGYPEFAVRFLYLCKLVMHCAGRIHAALLVIVRNR